MAHQLHVPLHLHHAISIGIIAAIDEPLNCQNTSHPAFLPHLLHLCKLPCTNFPVDVQTSPPDNKLSFRFPGAQLHGNFKDVFNIVFLSLAFLVCVYEAPHDLRRGCLDSLKTQLTGSKCRDAAKTLVKMLGANLEDQWMQTLNLAVTNWIVELQSSHHSFGVPSPLFSYALSASGLWKVQLYCPVIAMGMEDLWHSSQV